MNKTYLLVGGASVASLAVGTTAGYFFAKRKFDEVLDQTIAAEVDKTKKHYSILLMEARDGYDKPANPEEVLLPKRKWEAEEDYQRRLAEFKASTIMEEDPELPLEAEDEPEEIRPVDRAAKESLKKNAKKAMTNYQGYSEKPGVDKGQLIESNIFRDDAKKPLPPRDDTGRFLPKAKPAPEDNPPYKIEPEEFLHNDSEYLQLNLRYFAPEKTLIDVENNDEPVDIGKVGEVNLTLFPERDSQLLSTIYVRNDNLEEEYEIQLMTERLTDYMGLGDEPDEDIEDEYDNEPDDAELSASSS